MANAVTWARAARATSQSLQARSRATRRESARVRLGSLRLHRDIFGPIHCADAAAPRLRVLVVDDAESVRMSFAAVLRAAGFEVIEAADGFLALEALKLLAFDAVVLDLAMPVVDGIGVLDQMEDPPPVVLLTANDYTSAVQVHGDRIFGVMTKPVAPDVLVAIVGEAATTGRVERR